MAYDRFGAVWGQGVGLQGQTYAIPTMLGGVETIKPYVDEFIEFAKHHTEFTFLVTRIGCGIAGFGDKDIAPLFSTAIDVENVIFPKTFVEILKNSSEDKGEDPMPKITRIATADSWKILPMPDRHNIIITDIQVPTEAMDIIRKGYIPEAMEDHWFMYCDETTIRYYRSWTGFCIYAAKYEDDGEACRITELAVNREPEQYTCTDNEHDIALFMALLTEEYGGDASEYWKKVF